MSKGVPVGYKLTEVGVIPEDWDCLTVGQLVKENIIAKPLDGNHGDIHPTSNDYVSYGIPFIMANHIKNGSLDLENCKFITRECADKLQKGFSITGDVLLTHKGTVGNTAVVDNLSTDYIMLTPQVTYYRVQNYSKLNNWFLRHYFDSHKFQSLLLNLSGGGTRAYIGITGQLALPAILPPITEQRSIALVLSDTDALITSLDKLIAKKRDIKQSAMQQLLTGKQRLEGFGDSIGKFKQTEIGLIPEDWEVMSLDFVARVVDSLHQTPSFSEDGYPMVRVTDIKTGNLNLTETLKVSKNIYEEFVRNYTPKRGDIVLSRVGSYGVSSFVETDELFCMGQNTVILNPKISSRYLYYILNSPSIKYQIEDSSYGSGYKSLSLKNIKELLIQLPFNELEQQAIAKVLSDMDSEISALEQRRDKTKALKQAMMQELLTGRIRLL